MTIAQSADFQPLAESIERLQRINDVGVRDRATRKLTKGITANEGITEQEMARLLIQIFEQTPDAPHINPNPADRDQYIPPEEIGLPYNLGRIALDHIRVRGDAFLAPEAAEMALEVRNLAMQKRLPLLEGFANELFEKLSREAQAEHPAFASMISARVLHISARAKGSQPAPVL